MADSTTSYTVARAYKDTGKFEGIKGVECGKITDTDNSLLYTFNGIVSGSSLILDNGITITTSNGNSWMYLNQGAETTITFKSGSDSVLILTLSSDTTNRTVTASSSCWDTSPNDVGDLTLDTTVFNVDKTIMKAWGVSELNITSANGESTLEGSIGGTSWHEGEWILKDYERFKMKSVLTPSVSKQGICTFSEIVEKQSTVIEFMDNEFTLDLPTDYTAGDGKYHVYYVENGTPHSFLDALVKIEYQSLADVGFNYDDSYKIWFAINLDTKTYHCGKSSSGSGWDTTVGGSFNNAYIAPYFLLSPTPTEDCQLVLMDPTGNVYAYQYSSYDSAQYMYQFSSPSTSFAISQKMLVPDVSVSKLGVLTCSEFIEGDYNTKQKFTGTWANNKVIFDNGYTFETVTSYGGSTAVGSISQYSYLSIYGYLGEDDTTDGSASLMFLLNTDYSVAPGSPSDIWNGSGKLHISKIIYSSYNGISKPTWLKITDPSGKSVYFSNNISTSQTVGEFMPEESGDDELYIPDTDRYQNYLT